MIEVLTTGKNLTTHEKMMELFNKYTIERYHHNVWQEFSPNCKLQYSRALCIIKRIKLFIMELGTKVAY